MTGRPTDGADAGIANEIDSTFEREERIVSGDLAFEPGPPA